MANLKKIYEDDCLIIADKPTGLLVIPTPKNEKYTLTNLLNQELITKNEQIRAHPCHRLDRETSGLIIYAKGKKIQQVIMDQFHKLKVKKEYIAFIQGNLNKESGEIKGIIDGKFSITNYSVVERRKNFTIVRVIPITGRTNQIRIHFKKIGHPLVGESKYAFRKDFQLKFKRVCLHASKIEFSHPKTNQKLVFKSPLPDDLKKFLDKNN